MSPIFRALDVIEREAGQRPAGWKKIKLEFGLSNGNWLSDVWLISANPGSGFIVVSTAHSFPEPAYDCIYLIADHVVTVRPKWQHP